MSELLFLRATSLLYVHVYVCLPPNIWLAILHIVYTCYIVFRVGLPNSFYVLLLCRVPLLASGAWK